MKLSTRGRYGARAVLELAKHYEKGVLKLDEIAKRQDISRKYLEQIMMALISAGQVRTVRGKRGGFILTRPPEQVRLSEVLRVLEGSMSPVFCLDDPNSCKRAKDCVTRDVWKRMNKAMMGVLDSITLRDLADKNRKKKGRA
jgi:Rrf2 family protein